MSTKAESPALVGHCTHRTSLSFVRDLGLADEKTPIHHRHPHTQAPHSPPGFANTAFPVSVLLFAIAATISQLEEQKVQLTTVASHNIQDRVPRLRLPVHRDIVYRNSQGWALLYGYELTV